MWDAAFSAGPLRPKEARPSGKECCCLDLCAEGAGPSAKALGRSTAVRDEGWIAVCLLQLRCPLYDNT